MGGGRVGTAGPACRAGPQEARRFVWREVPLGKRDLPRCPGGRKKTLPPPRQGTRQRLESNLPTTLRPDASLRDERGSGVPKHQPLVILAHDNGLAPPSELRYGRLDCSLRLLNTDIGKSVFRLRPKFPANRQNRNAAQICRARPEYSTLRPARNTMRFSAFLRGLGPGVRPRQGGPGGRRGFRR